MRRFSILLLLLYRQCQARHQPAFSIHDDLFAHPQFEVIFSNNFVSEQEAQSLVELANGDAYATYSADFSTNSDLTQHIRAAGVGDDASGNPGTSAGDAPSEFDYEIMNLPPNRYLCSIPVFDAVRPENETTAELAKAEEAREVARASRRGWELLEPMTGQCLHFMSGWWSYRFCFGKNIVQYHALPQVPSGMAPVQDPETLAFMLGRVRASDRAEAGVEGAAGAGPDGGAELQVKGDQRYLVQRLGGGTTCDLTGRERTVEVQYHCAPDSKSDRIAWIKEVTTCAYLMVVNTPRLCDDAAFLPPRDTTAEPVTCRPILAPNGGGVGTDEQLLRQAKTLGGGESSGGGGGGVSRGSGQVLGSTSLVHPPVVGGIVVGGHNILAGEGSGDAAFSLSPPARYVPNTRGGSRVAADADPSVEVIATGRSKEDGGKVTMLTDEELDERNMDTGFVEGLVVKLRDLAGDRGWRLEVVEVPGQDRELRGIVDVEPGENLGTLVKEKEGAERADGGKEKEGANRAGDGKEKKGEGDGKGSQEHFIADEL